MYIWHGVLVLMATAKKKKAQTATLDDSAPYVLPIEITDLSLSLLGLHKPRSAGRSLRAFVHAAICHLMPISVHALMLFLLHLKAGASFTYLWNIQQKTSNNSPYNSFWAVLINIRFIGGKESN